MQEQEEGR